MSIYLINYINLFFMSAQLNLHFINTEYLYISSDTFSKNIFHPQLEQMGLELNVPNKLGKKVLRDRLTDQIVDLVFQ